MKRFLLLVSVCAVAAYCGANEPARSADYVGTVLSKMRPTGTSVSGLSGSNQPEELFGGYVFKPASRDFALVQDEFVRDLRQAIDAAGWTSDIAHRDPIGSIPGRLIIHGEKRGEHCEVVVFFFPVQDAKIGVSYSQITRKL